MRENRNLTDTNLKQRLENSKRRVRSVGFAFLSALLLGGILTLLLKFAGREEHEKLRRVSEVRSIVTACIAYSKAWDEFPPSLKALVPNFIDDESILDLDEDGNSSYVYRRGLWSGDYLREALIFSPPDEEGIVLVGFTGGHVTEERLESLPPEIIAEFE